MLLQLIQSQIIYQVYKQILTNYQNQLIYNRLSFTIYNLIIINYKMQEEILGQDFQRKANSHNKSNSFYQFQNKSTYKLQQEQTLQQQQQIDGYQYKNPNFKNESLSQKIITQKQMMNRRYNKLLKLRQDGYFTQQAIKLRQPLLYHIYIGQYSQKTSSIFQPSKQQQSVSDNQLLSQFLQKDLLNLQYKKLLIQQIQTVQLEKYINDQTKKNQKEIMQLKKVQGLQKNFKKIKNQPDHNINKTQEDYANQSMEIEQIEQEIKQMEEDDQDQIINEIRISASRQLRSQNKNKSCLSLQDYSHLESQPVYLSPQEMSLQQQALIEECQRIFLKGQQKQFNYQKIDKDESYDNFQEINKDKQQKYFSQENEYIQDGFQNYYTGQEDY